MLLLAMLLGGDERVRGSESECCVCVGVRVTRVVCTHVKKTIRWPQGTTARGLSRVLLSEAFCGIDVLSPQLQKAFFGCPVCFVLCEHSENCESPFAALPPAGRGKTESLLFSGSTLWVFQISNFPLPLARGLFFCRRSVPLFGSLVELQAMAS